MSEPHPRLDKFDTEIRKLIAVWLPDLSIEKHRQLCEAIEEIADDCYISAPKRDAEQRIRDVIGELEIKQPNFCPNCGKKSPENATINSEIISVQFPHVWVCYHCGHRWIDLKIAEAIALLRKE